MNPMLALRQYQKVGAHAQTSEASPHRLVQMLMGGGLDRIAQAKGALDRKDIPGKCVSISKAIGIIGGLREGLDLENCADAVGELDSLYLYMMKRLAEPSLNCAGSSKAGRLRNCSKPGSGECAKPGWPSRTLAQG